MKCDFFTICGWSRNVTPVNFEDPQYADLQWTSSSWLYVTDSCCTLPPQTALLVIAPLSHLRNYLCVIAHIFSWCYRGALLQWLSHHTLKSNLEWLWSSDSRDLQDEGKKEAMSQQGVRPGRAAERSPVVRKGDRRQARRMVKGNKVISWFWWINKMHF